MEITIQQALQNGIAAHKAGRLEEADRYYTVILKAQPLHSDANHNKGVLAVSIGNLQMALPFLKTALEANPTVAQYWFSYINTLIKLNNIEDAYAVFEKAKEHGATGDTFEKLGQKLVAKLKTNKTQTKKQVIDKPNILDTMNLEQAFKLASKMAETGNANDAKRIFHDILVKIPLNKKAIQGLNKLSEQQHQTIARTLDTPQTQLQELSKLYHQRHHDLALKKAHELYVEYPNCTKLLNILAAILKDLGQLDLSYEAFSKVIAIMPDSADAHYNAGVVLKEQGKHEKAITAFNKALTIKPAFSAAYNNKGNALNEQGRVKEAREAYLKALQIDPDKITTHRNLSNITKYAVGNPHIVVVRTLLQRSDLTDKDRCQLLYVSAKIEEDLGNFGAAFDSYSAGGKLRKKLLNYEFSEDQRLFDQIKNAASQMEQIKTKVRFEKSKHTPIFILGMPRSGSTLVEQIISSHTEVTGGGELEFMARLGSKLAFGLQPPSAEALQKFREKYLVELAKRANGRHYVTDKMPHNFRFIALISAAFPEAKIIHVQRSAEATCWSNFKQYFTTDELGYSYDMIDTVSYYGLYQDLMRFWYQKYPKLIYNLDYDSLTENQEIETRQLLKYLGLNWQDTCLTPEKNTRSIKTASQQQVRQQVYTGSSQVWIKFAPFLGDVFNELKSTNTSHSGGFDESNILGSLKLDAAIKLATKKAKRGSFDEAKQIYKDILVRFPKNQRAIKGLRKLSLHATDMSKDTQDPPESQLRDLVNLYNSNRLPEALVQAQTLSDQYPNCALLFNLLGAIFKGLGQLDLSVEAYNRVIKLKPDSFDVYNNLGVTLKEQGRKGEAIDSYIKALSMKPHFFEVYSNLSDLLKTYSPKLDRSHILLTNDIKIKQLSPRLLSAKKNEEIIYNLKIGLDYIRNDKFVYRTPLSQIYKRNSVNLNCRRHKKVFDTAEIIPEFCFGCFKVQVEVKSLIDLIKVTSIFYKFNFGEDLSKKTLIELRPNIPGHYKGLIYCNSLHQAEKVQNLLNIELENDFEQNISADIKRGCSEYPLLFPNYGKIEKRSEDMMSYPKEWKELENKFDHNESTKLILSQQASLSHYCLSDFYVIQKWIDYAKGLGDQSVSVFNDRPIIFPKICEIARSRKIK